MKIGNYKQTVKRYGFQIESDLNSWENIKQRNLNDMRKLR